MCPGSVYRFGQNKLKGFKISAFLIFSRTFYFKLFFYTTFWLSVLDLKHSVKKRIKLKDLSVIIRFIYMRRPVWHATWCHRKNILSQKNYTDQRTVLPQNRKIPDSAIIFNSLVSCV